MRTPYLFPFFITAGSSSTISLTEGVTTPNPLIPTSVSASLTESNSCFFDASSFTEIPRESYVEPEERTIRELKTIGKPFVVILNSSKPYAKETKALAEEMSQKYNVAVTPVNCDQLKKEDVKQILESVLMEFPIRCISYFFF